MEDRKCNFSLFTMTIKGRELTTVSNFLIPISSQHDGVKLWYFKLTLWSISLKYQISTT